MSQVEELLAAYESFVRQPWQRNIAGPQKVWFAVYDPFQERRLRFRIPEFEVATKKAGHSWRLVDLTDAFAQWMASQEYREEYFKQPELLELALSGDFVEYTANRVREALTGVGVDDNTVVAACGLGSLFGLSRVSSLVEAVAGDIRGRLLGFFPGQYDGSNYRLLDARDGWNYLAVPITAADGK